MDRHQNGTGRVSVSVYPSFQAIQEEYAQRKLDLKNRGTQVDGTNHPSIATRNGHLHFQRQLPQMSSYTSTEESPPGGGRMGPIDGTQMRRHLVNFTSELMGTYILVFLGCMGCVAFDSSKPVPHEQISFTFGLAVLVSVQCFGHISGSHINPIVTVASVVLGNTPLTVALVYILGQFTGALAGYGSLMLVTPSAQLGNEIVDGVKSMGVCSPGVNPALSPMQGLAVEFIASSMLVLVCCAVWDRKNSDKHDSTSVRFGLTIAVLAMAAGSYSGANMNPARSFAPALFNGDWKNHWVYWVGPLLAGIVPTFVYKYLFNTPPPPEGLPETIPLR